jgi:hypothetical protein
MMLVSIVRENHYPESKPIKYKNNYYSSTYSS